MFESRGLRIFGPNKAAAQLEGSKAFAKEILQQNNIPTAASGTFTDARYPPRQYLAQQRAPYVIKADGLAGGKGVIICQSLAEAQSAVEEILVRKVFGRAGDKVVIEEFLDGEEVSFMALTDGVHILPLASSQDHKRVFDSDQGPNTGGMGAYSPAPVVTAALHERILREILTPLLAGLKKKNIDYRGVIYVGLMITEAGPKVLEFNARFGDPECQPIMMRLESDLIPLLEAAIDGKLATIQCRMVQRAGGLCRPSRGRLSGLLRQRQRNSRAGEIKNLAKRFCVSCRHGQRQRPLAYFRWTRFRRDCPWPKHCASG